MVLISVNAVLSGTSEEVDVRQGQNALGSLSLSTGLTPSHNRTVMTPTDPRTAANKGVMT